MIPGMVEESKELMAKGPLLIPLAMIINNLKDVDWAAKTELTEQDLQVVHKGILASRWYPRALMERMSLGVFKVIGNNQPENAFQFGRGIMAETLIKIYRGPLVVNNPTDIAIKFAAFYQGTWFNSGKAVFTPGPKGGVFKISDENGIPCQACFVPMMRGVCARLIEENQGKNVRAEAVEEPLVNSQKLYTLTLNLYWE
jgi:hypothetical protein